MAAKVEDQIPLAPGAQRIKTFPKEKLVPLFQQNEGPEPSALHASDEVFFVAMGKQHSVVQAYFLLGEEASILGFKLGSLETVSWSSPRKGREPYVFCDLGGSFELLEY